VVTAIFVSAFLTALVAVLFFFAISLDYGMPGKSPSFRGQKIAGAILLCILAILTSAAIRWKRSCIHRERAMGIWIGMGVAFLVAGACFFASSR